MTDLVRNLRVEPFFNGLVTPVAQMEPGFFWTRVSMVSNFEGEVISPEEAQLRVAATMQRLTAAEAGTPYLC